MHEDDAQGLLRMMAEREILVEVPLSSNDALLGVSGRRHPLRAYLEAGVPVALVTDDEGVTRTTLTREFQRAVEEHDLDYWAVRRMARNSLEHAFVGHPRSSGSSPISTPRCGSSTSAGRGRRALPITKGRGLLQPRVLEETGEPRVATDRS